MPQPTEVLELFPPEPPVVILANKNRAEVARAHPVRRSGPLPLSTVLINVI
jgi:hypothetical protein